MQSVNNDMDDLFRRAAEDYPLQTNGADWNKVMQGLEAGTGKHMPKSTLKYKSFLWIAAAFLLLICTTYIRRTEPLMQTDRQTEITRSGIIKDKINTNDKITRELPVDVSETVA